MSGRADPLAILKETTSFQTKPRNQRPVEEAVIEDLAKENKFPSRQAPKAAATLRPKPRIHRTGRNQQFNAKATPETIQRFYKTAEEKQIVLGEVMKRGLDAMEIVDRLQTLADKKGVSLNDLVEDLLERAG